MSSISDSVSDFGNHIIKAQDRFKQNNISLKNFDDDDYYIFEDVIKFMQIPENEYLCEQIITSKDNLSLISRSSDALQIKVPFDTTLTIYSVYNQNLGVSPAIFKLFLKKDVVSNLSLPLLNASFMNIHAKFDPPIPHFDVKRYFSMDLTKFLSKKAIFSRTNLCILDTGLLGHAYKLEHRFHILIKKMEKWRNLYLLIKIQNLWRNILKLR